MYCTYSDRLVLWSHTAAPLYSSYHRSHCLRRVLDLKFSTERVTPDLAEASQEVDSVRQQRTRVYSPTVFLVYSVFWPALFLFSVGPPRRRGNVYRAIYGDGDATESRVCVVVLDASASCLDATLIQLWATRRLNKVPRCIQYIQQWHKHEHVQFCNHKTKGKRLKWLSINALFYLSDMWCL